RDWSSDVCSSDLGRAIFLLDVLQENGAPVRAAMVANHVGFRSRAAIHEIAKVYGLPEEEIRNVTKRLKHFWGLEDPIERLDGHPRFRDVDFEPPWPEILAQAIALEGHPRHLSVHSGGIVLVPDSLADHVPVEIAPKGVPIVQWEKDHVEDYGIMVYQEDVTKVSMAMAGFTLAHAEGLRKALGHKRPVKPLRAYQEEFFAGAAERGVDRPVVEQVWEMILSFAGYSFCKPHSA